MSRSFVRCFLCQGALPSTNTKVAEAHFEDQHRAYFNIDFLFKSSFLDENDIFKTLDFMVAIISSSITNKETSMNEDIFQINYQSELIEGNTNELNESKDESFIDRFPITMYDPVKKLDMFPSKSIETEDNSLCAIAEPENDEKKVSIENKSEESNSMDTFPIATLDKNSFKAEDFHCHTCDKIYPSEKKLKVHIMECHDTRKKTCHICNKEMIGNKRLRNHMKTHRKVICEICNKISSIGNLKKHAESCKKKKVKLWLICTFCNFKTLDKPAFKNHIKKMHNNACLNIESKEKIFGCDLCDYVSNDKRNTYKHKMRHSIIKHECTYCERKFNSLSVLNRHISHAHFEKKQINVEPKIYYCDICDYKTKKKFNVKKHQSRHSKTKPKKPEIFCEICNKKFSRIAKLNSHMETCKYKDHIFISM